MDREGGPRTRLLLRYVVRMEGLPVGAFTGCEGLPTGGDFSYGLAGTVRLTRRIATDSVVLAAWLETLDRPPRCTVTITAYDDDGHPAQAWRLRDAWPVRYVGPRVNAVVPTETLELAHSGVLRAAP
ncbi:MAG: phage tail protein [Frankiaceae bacterium]